MAVMGTSFGYDRVENTVGAYNTYRFWAAFTDPEDFLVCKYRF